MPQATATSGPPAIGPGPVMATNGYREPGFNRPMLAPSGHPVIGALVSAAMLGIPATGDPSSATTAASTTASDISASASTADTGVVGPSGITAPNATSGAAPAFLPITPAT